VPNFPADEVEEAFHHLWRVGAAGEDWAAQALLYTPDVAYFDHFYGVITRDRFAQWCDELMNQQFPELYTAYQWHVVDGNQVVALMQNRRDNPDPDGPPTIDFPSVSIFEYAGDGLWSAERDYWNMAEAVDCLRRYREACQRHDPEHPSRRSRLHWPESPDWAHPG
jgi:hypothetical protein